MFVKGEHQRQFAYEAHTACDKNGFVLETVVTPGNVHDSVAFDDVYDKLVENFPEIETDHICLVTVFIHSFDSVHKCLVGQLLHISGLLLYSLYPSLFVVL